MLIFVLLDLQCILMNVIFFFLKYLTDVLEDLGGSADLHLQGKEGKGDSVGSRRPGVNHRGVVIL